MIERESHSIIKKAIKGVKTGVRIIALASFLNSRIGYPDAGTVSRDLALALEKSHQASSSVSNISHTASNYGDSSSSPGHGDNSGSQSQPLSPDAVLRKIDDLRKEEEEEG